MLFLLSSQQKKHIRMVRACRFFNHSVVLSYTGWRQDTMLPRKPGERIIKKGEVESAPWDFVLSAMIGDARNQPAGRCESRGREIETSCAAKAVTSDTSTHQVDRVCRQFFSAIFSWTYSVCLRVDVGDSL